MNMSVQFETYDDAALDALEKCKRASNDGNATTCIWRRAKTGSVQIIVPKYNLLSGKENRGIYYLKLADELLRNRRVRSFLLNEKIHMNMQTEYRIHENELILLQTLITAKYFEDLLPFAKIQNARIPYDMANPQPTKTGKKYSNLVKLDEQTQFAKEIMKKSENTLEIECVEGRREIIGNSTNVWKRRFLATKKVYEWTFYNKKNCTFYPILRIFKEIYKTEISIEAVKEKLWSEIRERRFDQMVYKANGKAQNKYLSLLKKQGKNSFAQSVLEKRQTFEEMIRSEAYYLSNIDYWVLATSMKLPVILFTSKDSIKHLLDVSWLELGSNDSVGVYYFIRAPTEDDTVRDVVYSYNMISEGLYLDELGDFKGVFEENLNDADSDHFIELDEYMIE